MKAVCNRLRGFCLRHDWAANTFAVVGVVQFLATIWFTIEYQRPVLEWLQSNLIMHLPAFGALCIANVATMTAFVCLGFSECREGDDNCPNALRSRYRGADIVPGAWDWINNLGKKR